ncbi:toxin-antitoxin system HicB family antitoxin [Actinomycetospora endophytica]|uniref:Toxin-antitoxin system HicB family antitoxin n=1 Tax=Actinomycetospora endophytica TaxID=2291215 RepID=A0ABS8PG30_9PSEU|nr:toxin-antitoxin system HicB family antitoxin [Actinomycetospora endophytica]MCD2197221.1 toxin-antitoxin system HicB family antitoxin [Actinomycetospora endophytica]
MDLTPYVTALRDDLAAAASVGDEQTARAGTALAGALEPAVRLALMNALSDLAAEISDSLDDHSVSLRLRGREVDVVVDRSAAEEPAEEEAPAGGFFAGPSSSPFVGPGGAFRRPGFDHPGFGRPSAGPGDMGDISRMTLRLVDQIKGQAEQAAAAQGMSLNSWISQAVQGALHDSWGHGRGRGRGWDKHGWDGPGSDDEPRNRPSSSGDDDEGDSGVSGWVRG